MADVTDRGIPDPRSESKSDRNSDGVRYQDMKMAPPSLRHEDVPQPGDASTKLRSNDDSNAFHHFYKK